MKFAVNTFLWASLVFAQEPETEMNIHGTCTITGIRSVTEGTTATWTDRCTLETMTPKAGFNNLYRILVTLSSPAPVATGIPAIHDFIKAQNTKTGNVVFTSLLWGRITVSPNSPTIRASLASRAPAFEVRPQVLYISMLNESTLEIRVEEKYEDFDGKTPLLQWQSGYVESFRRLSFSR